MSHNGLEISAAGAHSSIAVEAAISSAERERARRIHQAFEAVASAGRGATVRALHTAAAELADLGLSVKRLTTLYYHWRDTGRCVSTLCRRYRAPSLKPSYPQEFVEWFIALAGNHKRTDANRQAMRTLLATWGAGLPVPGYGTWRTHYAAKYPDHPIPPLFPEYYPTGWSERSLYRILQAHKTELVLDRVGSAAVHDLLPGILRDVSKLRPLEFIVLDDFRPDRYCIHRQTRQVVRPEGLIAMDLCDRMVLALGLQPRHERDDGTRQGLIREDVRALVAGLLCGRPLPIDYVMHLLVENASAAITTEFEAQLRLVFGDRIKVVRTSMVHLRTLVSGFSESHGTPWSKGWIEAAFRRLHITTSHLPGETGPSYDRAPGDLQDRLAYAKRLLANASDDALDRASLPLLTFEQLYSALQAAFDEMADRTDHDLQGFEEVQFIRLRPELAPIRLADAQALLAQDPHALAGAEVILRKESPRERSQRLRATVRLEMVPAWAVRALALVPKQVTVRGRKIELTHDGVRRVYTEVSCPALERDGASYTGYIDPLNPIELHLCDGRDNYLCSIRSQDRVDIRDSEAIARAQAQTAQIRGSVHQAVRARHTAEEAALAEMRALNAALMQEPSKGAAEVLSAVDRAADQQDVRSTVSPADVARALKRDAARAKASEDTAHDWL